MRISSRIGQKKGLDFFCIFLLSKKSGRLFFNDLTGYLLRSIVYLGGILQSQLLIILIDSIVMMRVAALCNLTSLYVLFDSFSF